MHGITAPLKWTEGFSLLSILTDKEKSVPTVEHAITK